MGQHYVAGTVSGTTGNVAEEGTAPHRETTAASTAGRGGEGRKKTLIYFFYANTQTFSITVSLHHFALRSHLFSLQCVHQADLCEGVVVWRPAVGLLDELTVHFILQLRVGQAHLQSILGQ